MQSSKTNWWKIIVVVLVAVIVDMLLHQAIPITSPAVLAPSVIVERGWLPPVAGTGILVTFGLLAVVFVLLQANLPERKLAKGLWYGLCFAGLWLIGFIEVSVVWRSTTIADEVMNWLPDGVSIFLLSLLLGLFTAQDSDPASGNRARRYAAPVLSVAAFYLVGRYFAYWVVQTNAAYDPHPLAVLFWTVAMALWMGLTYAALGPGSRGQSPTGRALWFGGVVLGIDWLIFHLFLLIFFKIPALALVIRPGLDVLFVILGVFVFEKLAGKQKQILRRGT